MFCQKCGAELPDDAAECTNCGTKMYPSNEIADEINIEQSESMDMRKKTRERILLTLACLLILAAAILYALDYFNVLAIREIFTPAPV